MVRAAVISPKDKSEEKNNNLIMRFCTGYRIQRGSSISVETAQIDRRRSRLDKLTKLSKDLDFDSPGAYTSEFCEFSLRSADHLDKTMYGQIQESRPRGIIDPEAIGINSTCEIVLITARGDDINGPLDRNTIKIIPTAAFLRNHSNDQRQDIQNVLKDSHDLNKATTKVHK